MPKEAETNLAAALESHEGFVAPRYRSGQRSAEALLEAGRTLLAQISYEGLSVSDLCREADLTTGAFYRRFESKDAFFLALQRLALDDIEQSQERLLQSLDKEPPETLADYVWRVVDTIRLWHTRQSGVVRASIQRRDHTLDSWRPFKDGARGFVGLIAERMTKRPELRDRKGGERCVREAFQVVVGTMVNAALNDPGPLRLEDVAMTNTLARMVTLYVGDAEQ
jgi:AcrR family transcriptional regulator